MKDHTYKYESGALASPVTVTAPQPSLVERFMVTSGRGKTVMSRLDVSAQSVGARELNHALHRVISSIGECEAHVTG